MKSYHQDTGGMEDRGRTANLSFSEFCADPIRWATSVGGPRVDWEGTTYRTKWAWACKGLSDGRDFYVHALRHKNVAHTALKEEPGKRGWSLQRQ